MSAITTKIVEKYNFSSKMGISDLSQYTSEFLENLTDDKKRNQARRRLQDGFKFSSEQVGVLIPNQRSGKNKTINLVEGNCRIAITKPPKSLEEEIVREKAKQILQNRYGFSEDQEETIGDMTQQILRDKLSIRDVRAEAYALALLAKNANAGLSRLTRLRRELRNLNASLEIIEVTKFPDITEDANKIQSVNRKKLKLNALVDVMVMLCIRPAELKTLRITDAGVMGYAKNQGQPDIPRKFRSMEKNQERAKELLTWIQRAISSGRMGDPGEVYGAVAHEAKNIAHAYTIAEECLSHSSDNNTSTVQN
ncbi:hypothetical protein C2G38_2162973 [Gigaspora rosea]|uniref:Uncharacterized protein n=1 Tax=Gigaspora rosea TaxID=44941 RepID=A0A397VVI1_9GLOM|nr:hypothetical protein C2G38_2162973 [Gigaspora rosea]